MTSPLQPTVSGERIESLDLLRGIAILGILIMNIQSMSMPGAAYLNPTAYGDLDGLNYGVWVFSHLFADQKFITLFSMLFGAGILLVSERVEARSGSAFRFHAKRNFWLLIIGLVHAYLIWYGDILVAYALCSFLVFGLRGWSPRRLFVLGGILLTIPTLLNLMFYLSMPQWPDEALRSVQQSWLPSADTTAGLIAGATGTLSEQLAFNATAALEMHTFVFFTLFLWRVSGLMLIGMALYKTGVLTASRSGLFYRRGLWAGLVVGFPVIIAGIVQNENAGWSVEYSMFMGSIYNYWGSLAVSFGYLCAVMLFAQSDAAHGIKRRFAAIGRMALTNYLAQSVIGVLLFYGVGLGLFGQVDRTMQLLITLGVWALQYGWSAPWLETYRFGPVEWLWRSLTYMQRQPMTRR